MKTIIKNNEGFRLKYRDGSYTWVSTKEWSEMTEREQDKFSERFEMTHSQYEDENESLND